MSADSQMFESSQDSSQTPQKLKASCLTELEIFDRSQVFRLFTEGNTTLIKFEDIMVPKFNYP